MSLDVWLKAVRPTEVYSGNVTHNLAPMAREAGIYIELWHPQDLGIKTAEQLIGPLTSGLVRLVAEQKRFEKLNPENGWGSYQTLVDFVSSYLAACRKNPDATVETWG